MTALTSLCVHHCAHLPDALSSATLHTHRAYPTLVSTSPRAFRLVCRRLDNTQLGDDTHNNQLTGPLPTQIGLMTALQYMYVHHCAPLSDAFSSATPHAHRAFPSLVSTSPRLTRPPRSRRYLGYNLLTAIPTEVGRMAALKYLCVHHCCDAIFSTTPPTHRAPSVPSSPPRLAPCVSPSTAALSRDAHAAPRRCAGT